MSNQTNQHTMFSDDAPRGTRAAERAADRGSGKVSPMPSDGAMEIARPTQPAAPRQPPALQSGGREEFRWTPGALAAFRRSDPVGALRAEFGADIESSPEFPRLHRLMLGVFALRNERVTAVNNDEIFVLRTPSGEIRRMVKPVQLSLARKELYQIPKRQRNADGAWETVVEKGVAQLTVAGLHKLNAIAGCYVGLEPQQLIDGRMVNNPFIERWPDDPAENITGDVRRIVITAVVAGLTESGAPVVVRYTYETEPGKELLHKLAELHGKVDYKTKQRTCTGIEFISRGEFAAFKESARPESGRQPRWKYVPSIGGTGYAVNLADPQVAAVYADMIHVYRESIKKAQTVAIRNAMRAHPALCQGSVLIDQSTGIGMVRVVGWTGSSDAIAAFQERMRAAAAVTGQMMNDGSPSAKRRGNEEVIEIRETYEPGDDGSQADEDLLAASVFSESEGERDEENERRGALMALITEIVGTIRSPDAADRLMFDLSGASLEELEARLDEARQLAAPER